MLLTFFFVASRLDVRGYARACECKTRSMNYGPIIIAEQHNIAYMLHTWENPSSQYVLRVLDYYLVRQTQFYVQVNLCQKYLFTRQLTHNMTTDCSMIYEFSTRKLQEQNMSRTCCLHKLFRCCKFKVQASKINQIA